MRPFVTPPNRRNIKGRVDSVFCRGLEACCNTGAVQGGHVRCCQMLTHFDAVDGTAPHNLPRDSL
jgi:hypothetical protein